MTIVFALLAGVCAIGWLKAELDYLTLVAWNAIYIKRIPTGEEIETAYEVVRKKLLRIKRRS